MKKKAPLILLVVTAIVCMAIVFKGMQNRKEEERLNAEYARNVASGGVAFEDTDAEKLYEYYQTDPESGLAAIYTFRIGTDSEGKRSGSITMERGSESTVIYCAVKYSDSTAEFLFTGYAEGSTQRGEFSHGDLLVRLHNREKAVVPEWVKLGSLFPQAEVVRNY